MSARNHMTNDELVRDAVYWRKREKVYRNIDQPRWANTSHLRAQASENVLVQRIERILRGETKRSYCE